MAEHWLVAAFRRLSIFQDEGLRRRIGQQPLIEAVAWDGENIRELNRLAAAHGYAGAQIRQGGLAALFKPREDHLPDLIVYQGDWLVHVEQTVSRFRCVYCGADTDVQAKFRHHRDDWLGRLQFRLARMQPICLPCLTVLATAPKP